MKIYAVAHDFAVSLELGQSRLLTLEGTNSRFVLRWATTEAALNLEKKRRKKYISVNI